jgi:hypothetical protein
MFASTTHHDYEVIVLCRLPDYADCGGERAGQRGLRPEVGQVGRHRSQLATSVYATVDDHALRLLARRQPGGPV